MSQEDCILLFFSRVKPAALVLRGFGKRKMLYAGDQSAQLWRWRFLLYMETLCKVIKDSLSVNLTLSVSYSLRFMHSWKIVKCWLSMMQAKMKCFNNAWQMNLTKLSLDSQLIWDVSVVVLGEFWSGRARRVWVDGDQGIHAVLGSPHVRIVQCNKRHCPPQHADSDDVYLIPDYLGTERHWVEVCPEQTLDQLLWRGHHRPCPFQHYSHLESCKELSWLWQDGR